jgi:hypothetical protein
MMLTTHHLLSPSWCDILVKKFFWVFSQVVWFCFCRHQRFETSMSTKGEPYYPAENMKELLHENSLVHRENIKMRIYSRCDV